MWFPLNRFGCAVLVRLLVSQARRRARSEREAATASVTAQAAVEALSQTEQRARTMNWLKRHQRQRLKQNHKRLASYEKDAAQYDAMKRAIAMRRTFALLVPSVGAASFLVSMPILTGLCALLFPMTLVLWHEAADTLRKPPPSLPLLLRWDRALVEDANVPAHIADRAKRVLAAPHGVPIVFSVLALVPVRGATPVEGYLIAGYAGHELVIDAWEKEEEQAPRDEPQDLFAVGGDEDIYGTGFSR